MKAIVQSRYGSPDVLSLQDIDVPQVKDREVLIQVHAAGVHIGDEHVMNGKPYLIRYVGFGVRGPKARVRGMDVAGKVVAAGKQVTRFQVGDAVYGEANGSFAEFAVAKESSIALKPTALSFEQAAVIPTSASTALAAVRTAGPIKAGQRVLIIGASGGVGLFAVQIAKAVGAHVTGVASTSKIETVRSVGADRVIDYTREDYLATGPYDVILDSVSNRSLADLRHALTPDGTLVVVGGESGGPVLGILSTSIKAITLSLFVSQNLKMVSSTTNTADLQELTRLIDAGQLAPVIDRTYLLAETPEAMRYLMSGKATGKIGIDVAGGDGVATDHETFATVAS